MINFIIHSQINSLKMNKLFNFLSILLVVTVIMACSRDTSWGESGETRKITSFNSAWQFNSENSASDQWIDVDIPHLPRIEPLVVNDQWQGTMWYKKEFWLKNEGKKYFISFEGVMHEAEVWINDRLIDRHVGGYLPLTLDITDYVKYNEINEIKLQVNNEDNPTIPPGKPLKTLDFNFYGGIYRDVNLTATNPVYITDPMLEDKVASGGVLVHFHDVTHDNASGTIQVHIRNEMQRNTSLFCEAILSGQSGHKHNFKSDVLALDQGKDTELKLNISIDEPDLWSTSQPNLYNLEINLYEEDELVDKYHEKVGIRKIQLRKDGFYLNGEKLFIRGTNRHQEYPYVGYAISKNANYRDAVKIKQAGFDFVRLSHYPQDESFLEACDELGILVMNAIPGWQFFGDQTFIQNSYRDIRDMVRRDRNHPCVVFWEVSLNESGMTDEYMIQANQILKAELPFDDTYSAGWIDHDAYDLFIPARQHAKPPKYWNDYKVNDRPVFISEYGDWEYYAQNAGFNQTAFKHLKEEERTSRQLREYGEKRLLQQALNFQEAANSNRSGPNTIGHANWVMFDYNRGYTNDIEASGISDIFRIPKFAYYFYQSQRPPHDTLAIDEGTGPMVKIASYWTSTSDTRIRVFSNCEEVALYLNDSLISRSISENDSYTENLQYPPFYFDLLEFVPGALKAIGFINEKQAATDLVITPGEPSNIIIEIDESGKAIAENETDIVFVYAIITDRNGTIIPDSKAEVNFSTTTGELVGQNPVKAEAGIASILLKTKNNDRNITIKASANTWEASKKLR